jgi:hypothetical protein
LANNASSDDDFCWAGNEDDFNYGVAPKDNSPPISYVPSSCMPSLNHSQVIPTSSLPLTSYAFNQRAHSSPTISRKLLSAIEALCKFSNWVSSHAQGLVIADTRATDHMLPDVLAFISYKKVTNLSVRMGNNSFVPVLGQGTTVFSLNGKWVLVRNTLHVPGLAIPLYRFVPIYIGPDAALLERLRMASGSIFHPLSFLSICPLTVILPSNPWARLRLSQRFITFNHDVLPCSILWILCLPWHLLHILQLLKMMNL